MNRFLASLIASLTLAACGGIVAPDPDANDRASTQGDPSHPAPAPSSTATASPSSTPPPPPPPVGSACWSPPLVSVPAKAPAVDAKTSCARAAPAQATSVAETRDDIVGRWELCGGRAAGIGGPQAAGLEVSGTYRWRVLGRDASGQLEPRPDLGVGVVNVLPDNPGQINFDIESASPGAYMMLVGFSSDASTLSMLNEAGQMLYARVDAAPNDGDDNVASLTDGHCTLVGTWDYTASAGATGVLAFDEAGNWVGGAAGADLCAGNTMSGTYALVPGMMLFDTIRDTSPCSGDWGMTKVPTFDADCTHVKLTEHTDNCTGARHALNYDLDLTKR